MTGLPSGSFTAGRPERHTCILVCDADPSVRQMLRGALARREALHVLEADTLEAALAVLQRCASALVAVGPGEGRAVTRLRAAGFEGTLVVALAEGSVGDVVAAMRAGADDVVQKPLKPEDVVDRLLAATSARRPERRGGALRPATRHAGDFCGFLGRSAAMAALYDGIARVAASRAPVFIAGESGAGKSLAAGAVHASSPRHDGPFLTLDCRALSRDALEAELFGEGVFRAGIAERASGGTLLLDEICDVDLELQAKLLGFLETGRLRRGGDGEDREADVRLVCTTGRDPLEEVRAGRLREDLFYRLHVLHLSIPPLRARGDDVLLLAEAFLARVAGEEGRPLPRLGPEAVAALRVRGFRGNVRELQNLMRRAAVLADGPVVPAHLVGEAGLEAADAPAAPAPSPGGASLPGTGMWLGLPAGWSPPARVEPLSVVERRAIEAAIAAYDGNIALAAAALDLSPSTLYRKKLAWQEGGQDGGGEAEGRRLS
ncbi:sigma-54 dependent transcriptional regulator [Xanthobacter autotrophicus DSM 431]|uniref:sigma-54-dependent transcriptional regulator n=1 Tax=Xanthobacter nonsaccharivorans TaxID=3119912 RepID=UPI003727670D